MTEEGEIFTYKGQSFVPVRNVRVGLHEHNFSPILDHPRMKRLQFRGQLKPIDHVFSGAIHSRGEHCIGTFGIAQDWLNSDNNGSLKNFIYASILNDANQFERRDYRPDVYYSLPKRRRIDMSPDSQFLLLLYALIHDIGQGPFSHSFDLASTGNEGIDHKQNGLRILDELANAIKQTARPQFSRTDFVQELKREIEKKGPIWRLVSDKILGFDRLDYVVRDVHYASKGAVPSIPTIINNLYFDGENASLHRDAADSLLDFITALISNNTSIYINKHVETCEAFLIRAITNAVENGKLDWIKGYDMTDMELYKALSDCTKSQNLLNTVYFDDFKTDRTFAEVAAIKSHDYKFSENSEITYMAGVEKDEIDRLSKRMNLKAARKIEKDIQESLGIGETDVVITYSPQIERLMLPRNGGKLYHPETDSYKSIFDEIKGSYEMVESRLMRHYSISLVVRREHIKKVEEFLKHNDFLGMLYEQIGRPEQSKPASASA